MVWLTRCTLLRPAQSLSTQSFTSHRFLCTKNQRESELKPKFKPYDENYEQKVRESFKQQNGYFHGGVVGTLADNTGGYAAFSLMPKGRSVLTVEYKLNLLSPAEGALLISRGEILKAGKTLFVAQSNVFVVNPKGEEKLCATNLQTIMCLDK